jgi:hypothetical protein
MSSYTKVLLFLFIPVLSFSQKGLPIGQGILKVDYTKTPTLQFFSDTAQVSPAKVIAIGRDKQGEYIIRNQKRAKWFRPEQLAMDYDIFILRVDTVSGKWYKVFVDSGKRTAMWTRFGPEKQFMNWPVFLLKETTAIGIGNIPLEVKSAPDSKAKTIRRMGPKDCYEVLEIRGDWMRIRTNTVLDCDESASPIKSGWIKWRDKGQLTIEYFLTC